MRLALISHAFYACRENEAQPLSTSLNQPGFLMHFHACRYNDNFLTEVNGGFKSGIFKGDELLIGTSDNALNMILPKCKLPTLMCYPNEHIG